MVIEIITVVLITVLVIVIITIVVIITIAVVIIITAIIIRILPAGLPASERPLCRGQIHTCPHPSAWHVGVAQNWGYIGLMENRMETTV